MTVISHISRGFTNPLIQTALFVLAILSNSDRSLAARSPSSLLERYLSARQLVADAPDSQNAAATLLSVCVEFALTPNKPKEGPDSLSLLIEAGELLPAFNDHEVRAAYALPVADALRHLGFTDQATVLLDNAITTFDRCDIYRPALLLSRAETARIAEGWQTALGFIAQAERWLIDEKKDAQPRIAGYHREVRASIYGARAQVWTELGVWEEAREWLNKEREITQALGSLTAHGTYLMHDADYQFGILRPQTAETRIRSFLEDASNASSVRPEGSPPDPDALTDQMETILRGYQYFAVLEHARLSDRDPLEAEASLLDLASAASLSYRTRATFLLEVADSQWTRDDLGGAERSLAAAAEALDARTGSSHAKGILEAYQTRLLFDKSPSPDELVAQEHRLQEKYNELLDQWERTPIREGSIGFLHLGTRRVILSELIRLVRVNQPDEAGTSRAFELLLRAQAMGSNARVRSNTTTDLRACQDLLQGEGSGILAILVSVHRSHLFAIDKDGILHRETPAGQELIELAGRLNSELALRSSIESDAGHTAHHSMLRELSNRLKELLLPADIEARVSKWSEMTIVGAGQLGHPPLECLPIRTSDPGAPMLGQNIAVDYAASISEIQALENRPTVASSEQPLTIIVASNPNYVPPAPQGKLAPIPFGEESARRFDRFYQEPGNVLNGASATPTSLATSTYLEAPILHFVAHGTYDRDRERGAGLVLHGSGSINDVLFCADVEERLKLPNLQLALLTSCGSARGPDRIGDDRLTHLGGAFLNAGARAVVLTRAELEFDSAMRLMEEFHRHYAAGHSPAGALRASRTRGDTLQAYYDAQVHVVGAGQVPFFPVTPLHSAELTPPADQPTRSTRLAIVLVGVTALAALAWVTLRLRNRRVA